MGTVEHKNLTGTDIHKPHQQTTTDVQGDIIYFNGTSWIKLAKGTASQVLTMNALATAPEWAAASGSSSDEKVKVSSNDTTAGYLNGKLAAGSNITLTEGLDGGNETLTIASTAIGGLQEAIIGKLWAGDFDYFETNIAPLDVDIGTNVLKMKRQLFDDTTEEFINFQIFCPSDLVGTETIYIDIYGYATTAAASKNVNFKFYHIAKAVGETWDTAYNSDTSGDVVPSSSQDFIDKITISDTAANYGWTAGDLVFCKLSRIATSGTNLSGDYGVILIVVRRG